MRLLLSVTALGVAGALLCPSLAWAQSETLTACLQTFDGRDPEDYDCHVTSVPIGLEECDADPSITFEVRGVPTSSSTLDFWRSDGTSCGPTTERDGTDDTCIHLSFTAEANSPETVVTANLTDFLDCSPDQAEVTREIYVFAGSSNPERGDVPFGVLRLAIDTKRPPAPTDVEGGTGETAIPLEWESAGTDLYRHHIYVVLPGETLGGTSADAGTPSRDAGTTRTDAGTPPTDAGTADASIPDGAVGVAHDGAIHDGDVTLFDAGSGGGGTSCDTSGITAGIVPEGMEPTKTVSGDQRATTINASSLGLAPGDTAAVVVTAVDQARNESAISEPACIEVVDTVSFCERVGCGDDGCSCSAAGADDGDDTPWAPLALAAVTVGAAAWRRRRRG